MRHVGGTKAKPRALSLADGFAVSATNRTSPLSFVKFYWSPGSGRPNHADIVPPKNVTPGTARGPKEGDSRTSRESA
jgi:hypothetical protein